MTSRKPLGLCFRCEHRARHLENEAWQPRMECGDVKSAKVSCYMFMPTLPVFIERDDADLPRKQKDPRPLSPGMMSCRFHATGLPTYKSDEDDKADLALTFMAIKGHKEPMLMWRTVGPVKEKR